MVRARSFLLKSLFAAVAIPALLAATHSLWMAALGRMLVHAESPVPSDIIVVLAGDYYGHRILKAAELVKQGFAPKILVSGPGGAYGHHECDLAIPFVLKHGYPEQWFIHFPHKAYSTDDEARLVLPELRRLKVHRVILVTSDYHSARARRIFRKLGPDFEMRVVAAPDEFFRPDTWWRNRQARKEFFLEWSKVFASWMGL